MHQIPGLPTAEHYFGLVHGYHRAHPYLDINSDELSQRFNQLTDGYNADPMHVDYPDELTCFGYLYKFLPLHSNATFQMFTKINPSILQNKRRITLLGGGPGSELFGLVAFLAHHQITNELIVHNLDRVKIWEPCWDYLCQYLEKLTSINIQSSFTVRNLLDIDPHRDLTDAEIIIVSNVVSENPTKTANIAMTFDRMFYAAKKGSIFIFVDRSFKKPFDFVHHYLVNGELLSRIAGGDTFLPNIPDILRLSQLGNAFGQSPLNTKILQYYILEKV